MPAIAGQDKRAPKASKVQSSNPQNNETSLHPINFNSTPKTASASSSAKIYGGLEAKIKSLKMQNQRLEILMEQRDKQIQELRGQMDVLLKERKGIAGQSASAKITSDEGFSWLFILLLALMTAIGVAVILFLGYYYTDGFTKNGKIKAKLRKFSKHFYRSPKVINPVVKKMNEENHHVHDTDINKTPVSEDKKKTAQTNVILDPKPQEKNVDVNTKLHKTTATDKIESDTVADKKIATKDTGNSKSIIKQESKVNKEPKAIKTPTSDTTKSEKVDDQKNPDTAFNDAESSDDSIDTNTIDFEPIAIPQTKDNLKSTDDASQDADENLIEFSSVVLHDATPNKATSSKDNVSSASNIEITVEKEDLKDDALPELPIDETKTDKDDSVESEELELIPSPMDLAINEKSSDIPMDKTSSVPDKLEKPKKNSSKKDDVAIQSDPKDAKMIKSKAALDTLLELSETYIAMEDTVAAAEALKEVLEHGSDAQKQTANTLLKQLNRNDSE